MVHQQEESRYYSSMTTPTQKISYLCPDCSSTVSGLLHARQNAKNWFESTGLHPLLTGKHATGMLSSACNGVYLSPDGLEYASLMQEVSQSGFVEIEHGKTKEWEAFNLYYHREEPVAEIQIYGSGIGTSPFLKLPDIMVTSNLHGFAVTGCKRHKGECQKCGIRLFDHSSGSPLVSYSDWRG